MALCWCFVKRICYCFLRDLLSRHYAVTMASPSLSLLKLWILIAFLELLWASTAIGLRGNAYGHIERDPPDDLGRMMAEQMVNKSHSGNSSVGLTSHMTRQNPADRHRGSTLRKLLLLLKDDLNTKNRILLSTLSSTSGLDNTEDLKRKTGQHFPSHGGNVILQKVIKKYLQVAVLSSTANRYMLSTYKYGLPDRASSFSKSRSRRSADGVIDADGHQRVGGRKINVYQNGYDIEVLPSIREIGDTFLNISWDINAYFRHKSPVRLPLGKIGLIITHRVFGSQTTEEVLLYSHSLSKTATYNFSRTYTMENLEPSTGYLICFKALTNQQLARKLNFPSESGTESISAPSSQLNGSVDLLGSRLQEGSMTNSSVRKYGEKESQNAMGYYAYTDTGEIIYLPSKPLLPRYRNKRSVHNDVGSSELFNARTPMRKRETRKLNDQQDSECMEIVTSAKHNAFLKRSLVIVALSSTLTLVIILSFIIFCSLRYIFDCPHRCARHSICAFNVKCNKRTEGQSLSEDTSCSPERKLDFQIRSESESEAAQDKLTKKSSGFEKATEALKPSRVLPHHKRRRDFHPGYDIPPSSRFEVFGYDQPRSVGRSSRCRSPTPSSCELNCRYGGSMWDLHLSTLNLNIPLYQNKRSGISKNISEGERDISLTPGVSTYDKCLPDDISYRNLCVRCAFSSESNPDNTVSTKGGRSPEVILLHPRQSQTQQQKQLQKVKIKEEPESKGYVNCPQRFSAVGKRPPPPPPDPPDGEVIISGGTLIEVPDGYAFPKYPVRPCTTQMILETQELGSSTSEA